MFRILKTYLEEHMGPLASLSILRRPGLQTVKVDKKLRSILVHSNASKKSTVTKAFFSLFVDRFQLTEEQGISMMRDYLVEKKIVSLFRYKLFGKADMVALDFTASNVSRLNMDTKKGEILLKLLDGFTPMYVKDRYVSDDELIRLMHALIKYSKSKSRNKDVLRDFSYGLFPVRNEIWLKNKIYQMDTLTGAHSDTDKSRMRFENLMKKVKEWTPLSFDIEARKEYLGGDISKLFSAEKQVLYEELVKMDTEKWWVDNINLNIDSKSNHELFYDIVKQVPEFLSLNTKLLNWSQVAIQEKVEVVIPTSDKVEIDILDFDDIVECLPVPVLKEECGCPALEQGLLKPYYGDNVFDALKVEDCNAGLFEVKKDNADISTVVDDVIIDEPTNQKYREMIFLKFRFRIFTAAKARSTFFCLKYRPSVDAWDLFIKDLADKGYVSTISAKSRASYKWNLQNIKKDKFISYEYIKKQLNAILKKNGCLISLNAEVIRSKLSSALRPDICFLKEYFDQLVLERFLASKLDGKYLLYSII